MNDLELKYYSHPDMQAKFREAGCATHRGTETIWNLLTHSWLLFPIPIDRDNPERGLIGMLYNNDTDVNLRSVGKVWICTTNSLQQYSETEGSTPALALLKALAHQWGIKVEE